MTAGRYALMACGDDALRVLCGPGDVRHDLASMLTSDPAWLEVVPGRMGVTVAFDPHTHSMNDAHARLAAALENDPGPRRRDRRVQDLAVEFGGEAGPDLAPLAARLGRPESEIAGMIERSSLQVDMLGFTPGFAYLAGLDAALVSERLANPRTRVPAGSIGLITGQIGLYALDGPGGWPIVGRVLSPLFDRAAAQPFVLGAGDRVVLRRLTRP